ncbi:hypothetical protein [Halalkalibacter urbisdiaboli]|uniref:hypothetical protein n=1 Tax=Halalkalibacter urbisdiaboli TaxID=1960589 RepID=UPI000B43E96D|nr:hypothetical protein [Halalkalibacter urbisdiaboli]
MLSQYRVRLENIKDRKRQKAKWEMHLNRIEEQLVIEQNKLSKLSEQLKRESADVQRLEGLSFTNLFYSVVGKKLEKMEKEQQELLTAQLKYDEARETVNDLREETETIRQELHTLGQPEQEYKQFLKEKSKAIADVNTELSEKLAVLFDQESELSIQLNEYQEAISAGKKAIHSIEEAIASLGSAKDWSTWDMFGGGVLSTAIKHSRIDDAKGHIHTAQRDLRHFQEELRDINQFTNFNIDIGQFLSFADYFFDGFIVDWMVHGKIKDSLERIEQMGQDVKQLLHTLEHQKQQIEHEKEKVQVLRINEIERA